MIAPNYWVDYETGNDYFLSVQYAEHGKGAIHNLVDLKEIPLRAPNLKQPTTLDSVVKLVNLQSPTEIDHYKIQPVADVYVTPVGEDLSKLTAAIRQTITDAKLPSNIRVNLRGMVNGMDESFKSFGIGFGLSFVLLFLILVAQFRSWVDPFLIMLAIPMGFIGVLIILPLTHTTLNVMSLVGVLMLIGIADSNSILIVDFAHKLEEQGLSVGRRRDHRLPRAPAADSDDFACDHHRTRPHGAEARHRRRAVYADGARHHRRAHFFGAVYDFHRSGRLPTGLWKEETQRRSKPATAITEAPCRRLVALGAVAGTAAPQPTPPPPMLTLQQAETMALQNHPQIQAAQNEAAFTNQQMVEARSAYFPTVTADITGSQANYGARIGAGFITDSRLFDRFGAGFDVALSSLRTWGAQRILWRLRVFRRRPARRMSRPPGTTFCCRSTGLTSMFCTPRL